MTPPELTEKQFQALVTELATTFGWLWFHHYDSHRTRHGLPDLILIRDRIIFAELKSAKGKLSDHQADVIRALELAGAEVYVWRPADLQDVAATFARRVQREHAA